MPTIALELTPELEQQLKDEAAKQGIEPKRYILNTLSQNLQSKVNSLTESQLLQQINIGIFPDIWDDYNALITKRREESLSEDEQANLVIMSDQIEKANVQRIKALIELAKLRNTSLVLLMQQLGINPLGYV
jgi:hypothetical protein